MRFFKQITANKKQAFIFCLVLLVGFALRYIAATTLPLTNDEGSYLYDAYLLGTGHLPFLTSFSRSPGLMVPLAIWLKIFGLSVTSGRLLGIVASLSSAVLLYFIGKELRGKLLGFVSFSLYALVSSSVIHGSYLLTEPFEIAYSLAASLLLIRSLKSKNWFLQTALSGVFFGLAACSRETAAVYPLFLGLTILGWSFFQGRAGFILNLKKLIVAGIFTFFLWATVWGALAGIVGVNHVAKNFEAILKMHSTGERLTLGFIMREKLAEFLYLKVDYALFYILSIAFGLFTIIKRWYKSESFWLLVAIAAGPILFYGLYYQRIQPEYFGSFMPGFTLMSAWVLTMLVENIKTLKSASAWLLVLVVTIFLATQGITFKYQLDNNRGGTFYLKPIDNIVSWIKQNTLPSDQIFTAAVAIPLFSGRQLALDISRPVIFGYPHIKPDIKYVLFPTPEQIMSYLTTNQVKYYILEKSTRDSFYTGHDELKKYLEQNYRHLKTFDNPTNPIEILVRV